MPRKDKIDEFYENVHKTVGKRAERQVGSEVQSFLREDVFFIAVLFISGILLLLNAQLKETVLVGIFLGGYQAILVIVLASYVYLRAIRKKQFGQDEIASVHLAGKWVLCVVFVFIALMVTFASIHSTAYELGYRSTGYDSAVIYALTLIGGSALFRKLIYKEEITKPFLTSMTDGVSWIFVFCGIGALLMLEVVYGALVIADFAGISVY